MNHTPESKTVVIFEDDAQITRMMSKILQEYNVTVLVTFREALDFLAEQVATSPEQALNILAFVVDGNLSPGEHEGREGKAIIAEISKHSIFSQALIIGNSYGKSLPGTDYNTNKNWTLLQKLPEWIATGKPQANTSV